MRLKAKVLKIQVEKNPDYDPRTGSPDPSYFLEATVMDIETHAIYHCSFRDTFAEQLRQAYCEKWLEADRDALAREIEATAKQQRENQEMILEVEGIRDPKEVLTLLVRPIEEDEVQ